MKNCSHLYSKPSLSTGQLSISSRTPKGNNVIRSDSLDPALFTGVSGNNREPRFGQRNLGTSFVVVSLVPHLWVPKPLADSSVSIGRPRKPHHLLEQDISAAVENIPSNCRCFSQCSEYFRPFYKGHFKHRHSLIFFSYWISFHSMWLIPVWEVWQCSGGGVSLLLSENWRQLFNLL